MNVTFEVVIDWMIKADINVQLIVKNIFFCCHFSYLYPKMYIHVTTTLIVNLKPKKIHKTNDFQIHCISFPHLVRSWQSGRDRYVVAVLEDVIRFTTFRRCCLFKAILLHSFTEPFIVFMHSKYKSHINYTPISGIIKFKSIYLHHYVSRDVW